MQQRQFKWAAMRGRKVWLTLATLLGLAILLPAAGFAGSSGQSPQVLPASELNLERPIGDYVVGPQDRLRVVVLELKDMSSDSVIVDANGQIELPLIGSMTAAGMTTAQLEQMIDKRLSEKYLQDPHTSVSVVDSASQKVTVEGEVKNPGVFPVKGRTTLMQVVSMAGGPTTNANLKHVAVIRVVGGVRKAAVCDYKAITKGQAPDPVLQGDDTVVMDSSATRTAWSTLMQNLPIFTLLAYLR